MNTNRIFSGCQYGSRWITDKYICIMLLLFPLFTGFDGYSALTASKYIFFATVTGLWLASLLVLHIKGGFHLCKPHFSAVPVLLGAFFLLCCLSAALSPYGTRVLLGSGRYDGLVTWLLYCGIFFGCYCFAKPRRLYFYILCLSCFLCSLTALLQLLGFNPLWLFPSNYTYYDGGVKYMGEFLGTIGNAGIFSGFACLVMPLLSGAYILWRRRPYVFLPCLALTGFCIFVSDVSAGKLALAVTGFLSLPLLITSGGKLRRLLELSALFCLTIFLALSFKGEAALCSVLLRFAPGTRAFAAMGAFVLFFLLRLLTGRCSFKKKALRTFFVVLCLLTAAAALFTVYFWKGQSGTIYELSRVLHGDFEDSFGSSRILIWKNTLSLVPEHLLFGGGPDSLALRLDVSFSRLVPETGKTLSCFVDNAHNEYLGILVNTGLLSLLSFVFAQAACLVSVLRRKSGSKLCLPLLCGFVCYWIQAFFGLGLFIAAPFVWIFWALLAAPVKEPPAALSPDP